MKKVTFGDILRFFLFQLAESLLNSYAYITYNIERGNRMSTQETVYVDTKRVCCSGPEGALGHPAVYLDLTKQGEITCPYCSKHFILDTKPSKTA